MKWPRRAVAELAIAAAVALLMAFLTIQARFVDPVAHGKIVASLGELRELDAELENIALEVRNGLVNNYDPLIATLGRMKALVVELKDGAYLMADNPALREEISALAIALAKREALVEDFKSYHAVLKNSVSYLPRSVDIAKQGLPASDPLHRSLEELLRAMLMLNVTYSAGQHEAARSALENLRSAKNTNSLAVQERLDLVIQHAQHTMRYDENLDAVLTQLTQPPQGRLGQKLTAAYERYFDAALRHANLYRQLLTWLALGLIVYAVASFVKLRQNARHLAESEERYRQLVSVSPDAIVIDTDGCVVYANAAAVKLYGASDANGLVGKPLRDLIPAPRADMAAANPNASATGAPLQEQQALRLDGALIDVESVSGPISFNGKPAVQSVVRDITERKKAAAQLAYVSQYDTLTGLPNRTLFRDRLGIALARARRDHQVLAILFIDLDRFKEVNDTLGHNIGDRVLEAVAGRLREGLRHIDTIARLGGDEFTVIIENVQSANGAAAIADRVRDALTLPLRIDEHEVFVTASIGISMTDGTEQDIETLLKHADTAMYGAKKDGSNGWQFYSHEKHAKSAVQFSLESALRRALEREEFLLHYQPKVAAGTRRIVGVEALLRWNNPERGLVAPASFITLAEQTGMIVPIGEWVLRQACAQARRWQDKGLPPLTMAVNLSARQFAERNLPATIATALRDAALEPRFLELEITESMVMHRPEEAIRILEELSETGLRISIDDFGTGYSSLSYLKRFPVDTLKIDRSFVNDISRDPDDAAIVTAIIAMAHHLKLKVVAEGVETAAQLGFLEQLGCDEYQGYYFSKPLRADDLERLLARGVHYRDASTAAPLPVAA